MLNKIMNVEQLAQYLGYYLLVDYFDNLIYYIIILRLTLEVLRSTYTIATYVMILRLCIWILVTYFLIKSLPKSSMRIT